MARLYADIAEIQAKTQGLLGQKAWGVAPGQGSFVTMEFGQPLPPAKNKGTIHGEWHLWIYGCAWRLEQEGRVVAASEDDRSKIEASIQRLEGQALLSFEVQTPALDAVITFEGECVLRLFSNDTEEMDSWMLFTPEKVITVGPAGQWSYEA
jgi:hypothetical protein